MRMHPAVAHKSDQMKRFTMLPGVFDRSAEGFIAGELPAADGHMDALQFLIYDPAGTEIEVSDFAVAHLSVGQSDLFAAGDKRRVRIGVVQTANERHICLTDGVGRRDATQSPSVHDDEHGSFLFHAANLLDLSERPKTSSRLLSRIG